MRRLLALLTVLALLFAACGDDGSDSDSDTDAKTTSTAEGATAGTVENDPELDGKLLTADELGGEWSEDPGSRAVADESSDDGPECLKDPPNDPDHEKAQVSFTFDRDGVGFPSLQQQVTDYHDAATLTSAFDTAAAAIDGCGEFTYGPEDAEVSGSIEPVDGPTVGDASRTWTLHLATQGYEFTAYIFYARTGQFGVSLYYLTNGELDLEEFSQLVDQAIAKV
jgi:hypothetical protein